MTLYHTKKAFTLIELSIVLIIIGLLVGGVLVGQDLIKAAQIQAVARDYQTYQTAVNTFKVKYGSNITPGDWDEASDFLAGASDGDGNGVIQSGQVEMWQFWLHLSLAELISGSYTGAAGALGAYHSVPGVNSPAAPITGSAWAARGWDSPTIGNASLFDGLYANHLQIGIPDASSGFPDGAVVSAVEAYQIDQKVDDGKPASGYVIVFRFGDCTDAADETDHDADYDLSVDTAACRVRMMLEDRFKPS